MVLFPPVRGGDAVVPVEPVAAPVVPPLMSAPGDRVVESAAGRGRRERRAPGVPLVEPEPDESIELPDMPVPDMPAPDPPLRMLPLPFMVMPRVTPACVDCTDMLSVIAPRIRLPRRTDELWLIVETLAVSPFEFVTFV